MNKIVVQLDGQSIENILRKHIEDEYDMKVSNVRFYMGVKGDYDRGSAVEFVRNAYFELKKD